jgi:hypothetical protein
MHREVMRAEIICQRGRKRIANILTESGDSQNLCAMLTYVKLASSGPLHNRIAAITGAQKHLCRVCFSNRASSPFNSRERALHLFCSRSLPQGFSNVESGRSQSSLEYTRATSIVVAGGQYRDSTSEVNGYGQGFGLRIGELEWNFGCCRRKPIDAPLRAG